MISVLLLAFASTFSLAGVDFAVEQIGNQNLNQRGDAVSIPFLVRNDGDEAYSGFVRLRPFLIPNTADRPLAARGVLFDHSLGYVSLEPGESATFNYFGELPHIPSGQYVMGAVVNSDYAVQESNWYNNQTHQLVSVGRIHHPLTDPLDYEFDLYNDIRDTIYLNQGRAQHVWRLFKRGGNVSGVLRANFLVMDPKTLELDWAGYEKGVGWVNLGSDYDERGRLTPYDRYTNYPSFEHLSPGEKYLVTVVNQPSKAIEEMQSNNLDIRRFFVSCFSSQKSIEVWKTFESGQPLELDETIALTSPYQASKDWYAVAEEMPEGLSLSQTEGETSAAYSIQASGTLEGLDSGELNYQAYLVCDDEKDEWRPLDFHLFQYAEGDAPVLEAAESIEMSATSPFRGPQGVLTLTNSGSQPLKWKAQASVDWISLSADQGEIAPGASFDLYVDADPSGRNVGSHTASLQVFNNSFENQRNIGVTYTVEAP